MMISIDQEGNQVVQLVKKQRICRDALVITNHHNNMIDTDLNGESWRVLTTARIVCRDKQGQHGHKKDSNAI